MMWFGLEKTLFIPMKSYGESSWPPFTHHSEHSPSAWRSENQPIEEEEKCWQNNKRRAECDENSNTQEAACTWNVCFVCGAWAKKKHEQWNVCFGNTRRSMNLYLRHPHWSLTISNFAPPNSKGTTFISRLKTLKSWWGTRTTAAK